MKRGRRKRIAFIGIKGLPARGGADRVVEAIVARLLADYDFTVYCSRKVVGPSVRVRGVKIVRIPAFGGKQLTPITLLLLSAAHALLMRTFDVIHLHNVEAALVAPLLRVRYPVIGTSHGAAYLRAKWSPLEQMLMKPLDELFGRFSSTLTAVTESAAEEYRRRWRRGVHHIPNGVDLDPVLDEAAAARRLEHCGVRTPFVLFAAGRMDATKGCDALLGAYRKVPGNSQLVVIGDLAAVGAYGASLRALADARVVFIPLIEDKAELFAIVARASCFVFPSTVEAMSMMLLEAASLGVPVVCSSIPENIAVMKDHATYFEPGDESGLAACIVAALTKPADALIRAEGARSHVRRELSWDSIAVRYRRLYDDIHATVEA